MDRLRILFSLFGCLGGGGGGSDGFRTTNQVKDSALEFGYYPTEAVAGVKILKYHVHTYQLQGRNATLFFSVDIFDNLCQNLLNLWEAKLNRPVLAPVSHLSGGKIRPFLVRNSRGHKIRRIPHEGKRTCSAPLSDRKQVSWKLIYLSAN